jgi:hypothetical protein
MSKQDNDQKAELKRLLNPRKKKWKGAEVGRLLMYQLLADVRQLNEDVKKPLITQDDLAKMASTLTTAEEYGVYSVYTDLQKAVLDTYNRREEIYNQFDNGYYRLMYIFHEVEKSDEALRALENTPLIMTESQYKKAVAGEVETMRETGESYFSLIFSLLKKFRDAGEDAPSPIRVALDALKEIPATSKKLSSLYNKIYGRVYFTLPDGRRSDQMTAEEWKEATEREFLKLHNIQPEEGETAEHAIWSYQKNIRYKCQELFFRGAGAIRQFVLKRTGEALYGGDEQIERAMDVLTTTAISRVDVPSRYLFTERLYQMLKALGLDQPIGWNYCEELPTGLTAYDLLGIIDRKTDCIIYTTFKEDYPELYALISNYIKTNVPSAQKNKPAEIGSDFTTWGELADAGVIGYRDLKPDNLGILNSLMRKSDTSSNKDKLHRYLKGGVAILKNPTPEQLDERGDYIEEKSPLSFFEDIYSLEKKGREEIEDYAQSYIYPALRYIYTFNALMRIFEEVYGIKELEETTRIDVYKFERKLTAFNLQLFNFYRNVHGNTEEQKRKRSILKEIFSPLETEGLHPSDKAIKALKTELKKQGFTYEARLLLGQVDTLLERLMYGREGQ